MTKTKLEYVIEDMERFIKRCKPILTGSPGEHIAPPEETLINRLSLDVTRALKDLRADSVEAVPPSR